MPLFYIIIDKNDPNVTFFKKKALILHFEENCNDYE